MEIAGFDIESLSLEPDAVVFEIGIAIYNTEKSVCQQLLFLPDIGEQIAAGRRIDQSTIDWHVNTVHGGNFTAFAARLSQAFRGDGVHMNLVATYSRILETLKDVDAIWINGLSFDPVVISSLFSPYYPGRESVPWSYKKESDVRTTRRTLAMPNFPSIPIPECLDTTGRQTHFAVVDATWNVAQAYHYHKGMGELINSNLILNSQRG